jgi:uncharacterized protein (TIGR02145 family)
LATDDNGSCELPAEFFNCEGAPINDTDGDGIPDELEVAGCTDSEAGNYNPDATDDDGSCILDILGDPHTCGAEDIHNPNLIYGSVTDIDGNTYKTIVIGEQEWMAENLVVEHYANGDPIPLVADGNEWSSLSTGGWCYPNNYVAYACPYGKLYNWYVAVDQRNVCPAGWHVPSDSEWTVLTTTLFGVETAGGLLKSSGNTYWREPNTGATNFSGFSGLPAGYRTSSSGGSFQASIESYGFWWSTTANGSSWALSRRLDFDKLIVMSQSKIRQWGMSIRCLKD